MILDLIHVLALNAALLFAPVLYVASVYARRKIKHVILEWKPAKLVLFSVLSVGFNCLMIVVASLLVVFTTGRASLPDALSLSHEDMRLLALDSFFLLVSGILIYISAQNLFKQYVTHEGIIVSSFEFSHSFVRHELLRWEDISDYYLKQDYPVTCFNFLIRNSLVESYRKVRIQVPFSHRQRFQGILDMNLRLQEEIRERKRIQNRKVSKG